MQDIKTAIMADEEAQNSFHEEDYDENTISTRQKSTESSFYEEIFFIDNGSQSNIYCSAKLRYPSTTQERFLVGTLKGKVSCIERFDDLTAQNMFHSSHDMQAREVSFSYLPGDAELISMDAFYKHETVMGKKCLIVGVTLILLKANDKPMTPKHFFNVYNAIEPGTEFDLDKLAQVCQHQALGFIPYQLAHADIYANGVYETVFLLAGSDRQIHAFRGDDQQNFLEHPCGKYFPELVDIPGIVVWMDIKNCDSFVRVSCVGCENGYIRLTSTNILKREVLKEWTLSMDGPISSVRLFTLVAEREVAVSQKYLINDSPRYALCNSEDLKLLVTSALEVSVVFLDVVKSGFDKMVILNQSDQFDSVTCSCITDTDSDGNQEIILGTYGQEMLVYKWFVPTENVSGMVHFELIWQKQFSKPILSIHGLDLMGDGILELVVVSLTGVHILQHEVSPVADKLLEKILSVYPNQSCIQSPKCQFTNDNTDGDEECSDHDLCTENSELEHVISAICSTNNPYNELFHDEKT